MIGLLVVAHEGLAQEFLDTASSLCGNMEDALAIGYPEGMGYDVLKEHIQKSIRQMESKGVLLLVDLWGGIPGNAALFVLQEGRKKVGMDLACISGVNLPMLLEAFHMREQLSLRELKAHCLAAATGGIRDMESAL